MKNYEADISNTIFIQFVEFAMWRNDLLITINQFSPTLLDEWEGFI